MAIARGEPGRYCLLSCDAETGLLRRQVELKSGERQFVKIANDCDTWAALSEDGQLEVGRLESGARWTVRIPPNPQLHDWDFFDPYDNPIALSGNGKLCVVSDGDQITAVEVDGGSVRRTIQVPRRIFRLRISNDGKRLFAVCDPNPHTLAVLCDVADGHYTKLPAGIVASHASDWAGDDILASEADSNIMKITTLGKSRSYEKIVPLIPCSEAIARLLKCREATKSRGKVRFSVSDFFQKVQV
jgi:hypothetical protein